MLGGDDPLRQRVLLAFRARSGPPEGPAAPRQNQSRHQKRMNEAFLRTGPSQARARFLCAHGAGAGMDTPFLRTFAGLLADRGIATLRFEFAYMAARRQGGPRRPPPRAEGLVGEYRAAVAAALAEAGAEPRDGMLQGVPLVIGGKSMGGRVASLVAGELHGAGRIAGLVCLGYPFHPPGKPERLRTAHLAALACPTLIVQGERDPFGSRAEVEALIGARALSPAIAFHWAGDGDHDLGPRGGSGFTRKANLAAAAAAVAEWSQSIRSRKV
jgi:predicted alpha/beta-hydrolase family hydrolase